MHKGKFFQAALSPEEQKEFKGGHICEAACLERDEVNMNDTVGCSCSYKNRSAIMNDNRAQGCRCRCSFA